MDPAKVSLFLKRSPDLAPGTGHRPVRNGRRQLHNSTIKKGRGG